MKLQDYSKQPEIDGVVISTPSTFIDDGGEFREIGCFVYNRSAIELCGYDLATEELQINHSILDPGAIKAFHLHKNQTDIWYLLNKGIVVLHDVREYSKTKGITMRLVLENQKVLIPNGVLHGIGNSYNSKLHMIYFTDQLFDPKDEFREPWDLLGKEIWEIQKG